MKNVIVALLLLAFTNKAYTQSCNLPVMNLHTVYVFSTKTNHTMEEVMGAKFNPMLFNFVFVKTDDQLSAIAKQTMDKKLTSSVFVFFVNGKAIRYCNVEEFAKALENKVELKIEE
jgi:hypothetical protein